jgi:hypothetical protein
MTLIFAFLLMLVIVAAMSIGVVMGRKPIAGSCGGMKALGLDGECQVCGGNPLACERDGSSLSRIAAARRQAASLATDASSGSPERQDARTL